MYVTTIIINRSIIINQNRLLQNFRIQIMRRIKHQHLFNCIKNLIPNLERIIRQFIYQIMFGSRFGFPQRAHFPMQPFNSFGGGMPPFRPFGRAMGGIGINGVNNGLTNSLATS